MKRTYEQNKAKANKMSERRLMRKLREVKGAHPVDMAKHYELRKKQAEIAEEWEAAYEFYTEMVAYM